jgi:hypothetical protein
MDNPSPESNGRAAEFPESEALQARTDTTAAVTPEAPPPAPSSGATSGAGKHQRRRTYRPSHKSTFIGLAVVVLILAANAGGLYVVLKGQDKSNNLANKGQVTISPSVLDQLGVNRTTIGDAGVLLTIEPDTAFKGRVTIAGATGISGQVTLNGKLTGTNASFVQLQGGNTSLTKLVVNGDSTMGSLNLGKDLVVGGLTQLQGLAVKGNVTAAGNLTVSGSLAVNKFSARSLISFSTFTVEGHVITGGAAPGVGRGTALGSNGTVSISGDDAAGVVAINIGAGANSGGLASVAFANGYSNIPKVVITPVGIGASFYVYDVTDSGFSIGVMSGLPPGGYRVNYIVEQ